MSQHSAIALARARENGKRLGRPRVGVEIEARIKALRAAEHGILKIARILGVGGGTVQRVMRS
jgi:DNA invertase Pin-like site-specific DNA recombinase